MGAVTGALSTTFPRGGLLSSTIGAELLPSDASTCGASSALARTRALSSAPRQPGAPAVNGSCVCLDSDVVLFRGHTLFLLLMILFPGVSVIHVTVSSLFIIPEVDFRVLVVY